MCNDIMTRVPYATLIATIMCCLGVGIFCGTMYRGATLASLMMDQVITVSQIRRGSKNLWSNFIFPYRAGISLALELARGCTAHICYCRSRHGGSGIYDIMCGMLSDRCHEAQSLSSLEIQSRWKDFLRSCKCDWLKPSLFFNLWQFFHQHS